MTKLIIQQDIEQAIEQARSACAKQGKDSRECAARWDIVEELQAALADRQQLQKQKNSLEQYCDQHPEAIECRIYDV